MKKSTGIIALVFAFLAVTHLQAAEKSPLPGIISDGLLLPGILAEDQDVELMVELQSELQYTLTCLAIGCPPSKPYYSVTFKVLDQGFEHQVLQSRIRTDLGQDVEPESWIIGGLELIDGEKIILNARVSALGIVKEIYSVDLID